MRVTVPERCTSSPAQWAIEFSGARPRSASTAAGRPADRRSAERAPTRLRLTGAQCRPVPRRRAVRISRETSFGYSSPVAAHIRGNIDVGVKPGIVLISLR